MAECAGWQTPQKLLLARWAQGRQGSLLAAVWPRKDSPGCTPLAVGFLLLVLYTFSCVALFPLGSSVLTVLPLLVMYSHFLIPLWIFSQLFLGTLSHGDMAGTYQSLSMVQQLTSGGEEGVCARQPQDPHASRQEHKSAAPSFYSSRQTSLSLLPVLPLHFPHLGNKTLLTSATNSEQKASTSCWFGRPPCCEPHPACQVLEVSQWLCCPYGQLTAGDGAVSCNWNMLKVSARYHLLPNVIRRARWSLQQLTLFSRLSSLIPHKAFDVTCTLMHYLFNGLSGTDCSTSLNISC